MKLLKYIFYRLYQLMLSVGNRDVAEYYAVLLMTMLIGLNIAALSAFVYLFTGLKIDILFGSRTIILVEYLTLAFIFYFLFIRKDKHLEIVKSYDGESQKDELR